MVIVSDTSPVSNLILIGELRRLKALFEVVIIPPAVDFEIKQRIGTHKARESGLKTIGLLGVLVKAKEKGIIKKVKPAIDKLMEIAGFWIGDKLVDRVLREVNER